MPETTILLKKAASRMRAIAQNCETKEASRAKIYWSHEIVLIDGVTVTVKVAHVRLCHCHRCICDVNWNNPAIARPQVICSSSHWRKIFTRGSSLLAAEVTR